MESLRALLHYNGTVRHKLIPIGVFIWLGLCVIAGLLVVFMGIFVTPLELGVND